MSIELDFLKYFGDRDPISFTVSITKFMDVDATRNKVVYRYRVSISSCRGNSTSTISINIAGSYTMDLIISILRDEDIAILNMKNPREIVSQFANYRVMNLKNSEITIIENN